MCSPFLDNSLRMDFVEFNCSCSQCFWVIKQDILVLNFFSVKNIYLPSSGAFKKTQRFYLLFFFFLVAIEEKQMWRNWIVFTNLKVFYLDQRVI